MNGSITKLCNYIPLIYFFTTLFPSLSHCLKAKLVLMQYNNLLIDFNLIPYK